MQIIKAGVVPANNSPATPKGISPVEQVRRNTFLDFVQQPNDRFTTDDKAILIQLVQALIDTDNHDYISGAYPEFATKIAVIEKLAVKSNIDLKTVAPYEDRAQELAMNIVEQMRGWTDKEVNYALTAGSFSGTKFSVSMKDGELHLSAKDLLHSKNDLGPWEELSLNPLPFQKENFIECLPPAPGKSALADALIAHMLALELHGDPAFKELKSPSQAGLSNHAGFSAGLCAPSIFYTPQTSILSQKHPHPQQNQGLSADETFGRVLLAQAIANNQNQRL